MIRIDIFCGGTSTRYELVDGKLGLTNVVKMTGNELFLFGFSRSAFTVYR